MMKQVECARLAQMIGWRIVATLEDLKKLGVPDAVHGECVWIPPENYTRQTHRLHRGVERWIRDLDFDPWEDANDDVLILEYYRYGDKSVLSDYKDALYHDLKGHGTHNVWEYYKGKFANAAIMLLNK